MATYFLPRHPVDPYPIRDLDPDLLIVQLAPGSPIDRLPRPRISPEQLEALIRLYGLDKPLFEQYLHWITAFFQVWRIDAWGYSFIDGRRSWHISLAFRRRSCDGSALIVTLVFAIPIGILAAVKQYTRPTRSSRSSRPSATSIPSFLLGIYLLLFGGVILRTWTGFGFPLFGRQSLGKDNDPVDLAVHLVLPVAASPSGASPASPDTCARPCSTSCARTTSGRPGPRARMVAGWSDGTRCATR